MNRIHQARQIIGQDQIKEAGCIALDIFRRNLEKLEHGLTGIGNTVTTVGKHLKLVDPAGDLLGKAVQQFMALLQIAGTLRHLLFQLVLEAVP
jgi:hypothetical protein